MFGPKEAFLPQCLQSTLKFPMSVMAWGCITYSGVCLLHFAESSVNGDKHTDILWLVPSRCLAHVCTCLRKSPFLAVCWYLALVFCAKHEESDLIVFRWSSALSQDRFGSFRLFIVSGPPSWIGRHSVDMAGRILYETQTWQFYNIASLLYWNKSKTTLNNCRTSIYLESQLWLDLSSSATDFILAKNASQEFTARSCHVEISF